MNKATSHSLYYWKLSANSPKGYLPETDVNQNSDTLIYQGVAFSNLGCEQSEQHNIT